MSHIVTLIDRFDSKRRAKYIINMIDYCILPPYDEVITDEYMNRVGQCVREYGDEHLINFCNKREEISCMDDSEKVRMITELDSMLDYLEHKEREDEQRHDRKKIRLELP